MKPRHVIPFLVLLFWQLAPVQLERAPSGRYRLSFGFSAGTYQQDYTDCDGNTATRTEAYGSMGALVDARPAPAVRVSAYGGLYTLGGDSVKGGKVVGGFQLAWEGRRAGLGGGLAGATGSHARDGLSAYLRIGDADGVHFRADLRQPTETWLATGWARIGVGNNLGTRRGRGVFAGLSRVVGHAPLNGVPGDATALFADVTVPVGSDLDLLLRGHVGAGVFGVGVGGGYTFGPRGSAGRP